MRIVKDADGDLWQETRPGRFEILFPRDEEVSEIDGISSAWGPFEVYGRPCLLAPLKGL